MKENKENKDVEWVSYRNINVDPDRYEKKIAVQLINETSFREQFTGSRRKLYVHSKNKGSKYKLCATTTTSKSKSGKGQVKGDVFNRFINEFNNCLAHQLYDNEPLYNLIVPKIGKSRIRNKDIWKEIPIGFRFHNIDLDSAYWQILYRLGYINELMFDKYIRLDEYKDAKRFCVTMLNRKCFSKDTFSSARYNEIANYFNSKEPQCFENQKLLELSNPYIIDGDEYYQIILKNVRQELFNVMHEALNGISNFFHYATDGVCLINYEDFIRMSNYFKSQKLIFKGSMCTKLDENTYSCGFREKNFK